MRLQKLLALLLAVTMLLGMTSVSLAEDESSTPLVVGYASFGEKFSPFFADWVQDRDVTIMTNPEMLIVDRTGAIVYNAIEGETISYNGTDYTYTGPIDLTVEQNGEGDDLTTTYTLKLREDILFSDGTPMTADDIIFTYYVLLDPGYMGSATLSTYDIVGLAAYRTGLDSDSLAAVNAKIAAIKAIGDGYTPAEGGVFTQEEYDAYWPTFKADWVEVCQGIVDYVYAAYGEEYAESYIGITYDELTDSEGWQMILGMYLWGFGSFDIETGVFAYADDKSFDTAQGEFPTIEDYFAATLSAYEADGTSFYDTENAEVGANPEEAAQAALIEVMVAAGDATQVEVANIEGIKKVDDYTVTVTVNGFSAPAVYQIAAIQTAPKDYYGDGTYDYDANNFGHPLGDLSVVESKTNQPVGYGPYKFVKYENKVVYFEANEYYYKGEPAIKYMQWKETDEGDYIPGVTTGTIDIGEPSFSKDVAAEIKGYNSNGELSGDTLYTVLTDYLGYGYIGINSALINVGGVPDSEESRNLRRALTTVLAVYRDVAVDSYYGDVASVINYPISNTSWAAPQKTDADYKVAFSTALDGSDIYTADMTAEEKYDAALAAAVEYLKAAGYTFGEDGMIATVPEGASAEYEALVTGYGTGSHPSFSLLTDASNALATIGLKLTITDFASSATLMERLDADTAEIWCAAWSATVDPDMYQIYYSGNVVGEPNSTESNHYRIQDAQLDDLIVEARVSADQAFRKAVYKSCLDIIIEWAVELPVYQRKEAMVVSSERVNVDTLCQDITTFYGWLLDIETLELN